MGQLPRLRSRYDREFGPNEAADMEAEMTILHESTGFSKRHAEGLSALWSRLRPLARAASMAFAVLWFRLQAERRRVRAQRDLEVLSDSVLKDIGIARSEIPWAAARPSEPWRGERNDTR